MYYRHTRREMFCPTGKTGTIPVRCQSRKPSWRSSLSISKAWSTVSKAAVKSSRQREGRHLSTIGREQQIVIDLRDRSLSAMEATVCRLRLRHEIVAVAEFVVPVQVIGKDRPMSTPVSVP